MADVAPESQSAFKESPHCWTATVKRRDVEITREHKAGWPYNRVFDVWSASGSWAALEQEVLVLPEWKPAGRKRTGRHDLGRVGLNRDFMVYVKAGRGGTWTVWYHNANQTWQEHLLTRFIEGDLPALRLARRDAGFQRMLDEVTCDFWTFARRATS